MGELLGDIVTWMQGLSPVWIYVTVFGVAYLENVVPPIPGDMIVVFGGYLAGLGQVGLVPVILLATVAGTLGFMSMYAVGRTVGEAVLDPDRMRWIPKQAAWKVRAWLQKYGYGVVAANRFLSGARAVISLMVGVARMPAGPVAVWAALSAAVWTGIIAYLGAVVGDNWALVGEWLKRYGQGVTVVLVVVAVVYVGLKAWQRRAGSQRNGEDPKTGISDAPES
ncbi:MAG: DedA family protein [Rhodothermales bacterium]